jgi:hypothetical protein
MVCSVIFSQKDGASHVNATATLSNGRTMQDNFEVALEI